MQLPIHTTTVQYLVLHELAAVLPQDAAEALLYVLTMISEREGIIGRWELDDVLAALDETDVFEAPVRQVLLFAQTKGASYIIEERD